MKGLHLFLRRRRNGSRTGGSDSDVHQLKTEIIKESKAAVED